MLAEDKHNVKWATLPLDFFSHCKAEQLHNKAAGVIDKVAGKLQTD